MRFKLRFARKKSELQEIAKKAFYLFIYLKSHFHKNISYVVFRAIALAKQQLIKYKWTEKITDIHLMKY